jgi:hypothetical protein
MAEYRPSTNTRRRDREVSEDAVARKGPSSVLDGLVESLRKQYPRESHGARLNQIEQLVNSVSSLIDMLPDEEMREADHEKRLLDDFARGETPLPGSDAHRKLVAAMARRQDGGSEA